MTETRKIDGKAFDRSLKACKDENEVFGLLNKTMGPEVMKKIGTNAKYISDLSSVVRMNGKVAELKAMRGSKDITNEEFMAMAATKYMSLTNKDTKCFRAAINKYVTRETMEKQKTQTTEKTDRMVDFRDRDR